MHTNLGRAPLPATAQDAVARVAAGYSNLELDLDTGERGSRHDHVAGLLCELTGAQDAIVVNNGAGAVLLAAAALAGASAGDPAIIVSRGQLVEIGGGFRIPDVIAQSGATMIEVGTTNRTRLADYERALAAEAVVLRVHQSNFRTLGFVSEVAIEELCGLGVPVIDDVGSGRARRRRPGAGRRAVAAALDRGRGGARVLLGRQAARRPAGRAAARHRRGDRRRPRAPAGPRAADRQALAGRARGDAGAVPRPGARPR